jgi:hypothetical protein
MNAAGLHSPRLQRVLHLLSDGRPHTTRDIVRKARVMAVNACISELRFHGAAILCTRQHVDGQPRFFYTMTKGPDLK